MTIPVCRKIIKTLCQEGVQETVIFKSRFTDNAVCYFPRIKELKKKSVPILNIYI